MYTKFIRYVSILSFIPFIFISGELFAYETYEVHVTNSSDAAVIANFTKILKNDTGIFPFWSTTPEMQVKLIKEGSTNDWDCRLYVQNQHGTLSVESEKSRCNDTFNPPNSVVNQGTHTVTFTISSPPKK